MFDEEQKNVEQEEPEDLARDERGSESVKDEVTNTPGKPPKTESIGEIEGHKTSLSDY